MGTIVVEHLNYTITDSIICDRIWDKGLRISRFSVQAIEKTSSLYD